MACLYFLLAGWTFLFNIGVEHDETIFAMAFLKPTGGAYAIRIGHSHIPLMIMSYIGTLKAWLYRPILRMFGTGMLPLRLPMLLAGVASLWLFFLLLRRIAGERAAIIGCTLLAADATYLLTICFDWGPFASGRATGRCFGASSCWGWRFGIKPWQCGCYRASG
jgi:4-amino-4-deoxy-L-arabinose transferase-like glycosyltransferase